MKIPQIIRLSLAIATLAGATSSPGQVGGPALAPPPPATIPVETKAEKIPVLRIADGPLVAAVEQLSATLGESKLPAMNIIYSPEARGIQVPELVLRNVTGPDALRLIAVSAGCAIEEIAGTDGEVIGFRVYSASAEAPAGFDATPPAGGAGIGGPQPVPAPPGIPGAEPPVIGAPPIPGAGPTLFGGAMPGAAGAPYVMNYGGMPASNPNEVRIYSLGGITNLVKFTEVEKTLLDVLKADSIPANAAKLAFHEGTNVLVVTADARVHGLVNQFLQALQKNSAIAADEQKNQAKYRNESVELMIRLDAEKQQRARVEKQLEEAEQAYREARRELDRVKATAPKGQ